MILTHDTIKAKKYCRIISLVPSQTELLSYLNLEKEVIGITKFCVHPHSWFINKPRIGGTKNINADAVHRLAPDLIIANKEENVKEQIEELANYYDVWVTDVNDLSGALAMTNDIGLLTDKTHEASGLVHKIKAGFDELKESSSEGGIRVAYFIWKDPYMVAAGNTFIDDIIHHIGLANVFSDLTRYPSITLEDVRDRNCTHLLLSSEPYPFGGKHKKEIQRQLPGIKIELADGEMFSWYGSRLLLSIDYFHSFLFNL